MINVLIYTKTVFNIGSNPAKVVFRSLFFAVVLSKTLCVFEKINASQT
jgi:hypothetical protein